MVESLKQQVVNSIVVAFFIYQLDLNRGRSDIHWIKFEFNEYHLLSYH